MKKILLSLAAIVMMAAFTCCSRGFNRDKAEDILQNKEITEEEYDVLLQQYEYCIDDAISLSKKDKSEISADDREELITMFAIGKRLAIDEDKLTDSQKKEFSRINHKGTEQLSK